MIGADMKDIKFILRDEIERVVHLESLLEDQKLAFEDVSEHRIHMTPVGHLDFEENQGECHIKSGFIEGDSYFCVKVATSFFKNPALGLQTGNGLMSVWSMNTGAIVSLICDEGYLTDLRTGLAGIIATQHADGRIPRSLGIFGTGQQAYLQLKLHKHFFGIHSATICGRSEESLERFKMKSQHLGVDIVMTRDPKDILMNHNLIITTTASKNPLFESTMVQPGTHITALGADGGGKQELDPYLFGRAQRIYVDSIDQCSSFGDSSYALRLEVISKNQLSLLGATIKNPVSRQVDDITIADLTGIASQDIRIATWFYHKVNA